MADKTKEKKEMRWAAAGICIPAGLFIGMGVGFATNELVAGLFIGLGGGFTLFALMMALMVIFARD